MQLTSTASKNKTYRSRNPMYRKALLGDKLFRFLVIKYAIDTYPRVSISSIAKAADIAGSNRNFTTFAQTTGIAQGCNTMEAHLFDLFYTSQEDAETLVADIFESCTKAKQVIQPELDYWAKQDAINDGSVTENELEQEALMEYELEQSIRDGRRARKSGLPIDSFRVSRGTLVLKGNLVEMPKRRLSAAEVLEEVRIHHTPMP